MLENSTAELVAHLRDPNRWMRDTALRVLADRRTSPRFRFFTPCFARRRDSPLGGLLGDSSPDSDRRGTGSRKHAASDPHVRLWSVRLSCDDGEVSSRLAEELRDLARRETNVEVRSQLAASARRLPATRSFPMVAELLRHDEDVADIHIPLLLWWAIEAKAESDRAAVLDLFSNESLWKTTMVQEHILERIMRRYASAGSRANLLACAELLKRAPDTAAAERLMKGFELAYEGRLLTGLPDELVEQMSRIGGGSFVLQLRQGDNEALSEAVSFIANESSEVAKRTLYIQVLGQVRHQASVPVLLELVKHSPNQVVRSAALSALQTFSDRSIAEKLIAMHDELPPDMRGASQSVLAGRPEWSHLFLTAIQQKDCDQDLVPLVMVRRLLLHDDERISVLVQSLWGDVAGASTDEMRETIEQLTQVLDDGVGNPYSGKVIYGEQCGKCHRLFQQGGEIGPDLTSFRRDDVRSMLVNIVNPSLEIREGYENYVIITDDGRTLNGFLVDQDNQTVVLRDTEGQTTVVARDEIEEMHAIARSIMPEGILQEFTEQQVRDLFAYLRATQPLP
jgi:putative heme-binding domain-containing protein